MGKLVRMKSSEPAWKMFSMAPIVVEFNRKDLAVLVRVTGGDDLALVNAAIERLEELRRELATGGEVSCD